MLSQPLAMYKIIDLSRVRAGPTAVRQLSDWGADVIKIEIPKENPDNDDDTDRSDYQNMQRNKRSIAINLKHPEGRDILKKLVVNADVLIENFRPDVKFRLGIDYETLKTINPRLIYASISGFGQTGPYRTRPGYDQIIQGMGGLMSVTGLPGQGPVRAGIPIADLSTGLLVANAILIAIIERQTSGQGQWIETSLLASQIFMLDLQAVRYLIDKEVPEQAGNDHPTTIPTGTFRTADGHVNLAASEQSAFRRLCKLLKLDELIDHPDYLTVRKRSENRQKLNEQLEKVLSTETSSYWVEKLNEVGIACGPINRIDQMFADPQVQQLKLTRKIENPRLGSINLVGQPIFMSRSQWSIRRRAPGYAEHTKEILGELGYDSNQINDLICRNVVDVSTSCSLPSPSSS